MILRLQGADGGEVGYKVELHTPSGSWVAFGRLVLVDGSVHFDDWAPPAPPAWLVQATRAQLRAMWRSHADDGAWPRRITRWRAAPAS